MRESSAPLSCCERVTNKVQSTLAIQDSPRSGSDNAGLVPRPALDPAKSRTSQPFNPQKSALHETQAQPSELFSEAAQTRKLRIRLSGIQPKKIDKFHWCYNCNKSRPRNDFVSISGSTAPTQHCISCRIVRNANDSEFLRREIKQARSNNTAAAELKQTWNDLVDTKLKQWKERCKTTNGVVISSEHFNEIKSDLSLKKFLNLDDIPVVTPQQENQEFPLKRKRDRVSYAENSSVEDESGPYEDVGDSNDDTISDNDDGETSSGNEVSVSCDLNDRAREIGKGDEERDSNDEDNNMCNRDREMINGSKSPPLETQSRETLELEKTVKELIANSEQAETLMRRLQNQIENPKKKKLEEQKERLTYSIVSNKQQKDELNAEFNRAKVELENEIARLRKAAADLRDNFEISKAELEIEGEEKLKELEELDLQMLKREEQDVDIANRLDVIKKKQSEWQEEIRNALAPVEEHYKGKF